MAGIFIELRRFDGRSPVYQGPGLHDAHLGRPATGAEERGLGIGVQGSAEYDRACESRGILERGAFPCADAGGFNGAEPYDPLGDVAHKAFHDLRRDALG